MTITRRLIVSVTLCAAVHSAGAFTFPVSSVRAPSFEKTKMSTRTGTKMGSSQGGQEAVEKPFGTWDSPITSKSITAGSIGIGSLQVRGNELFWIEARPQEGGRSTLCKYDPTAENKSERNAVEVTPTENSVRTTVHEYGGAGLMMGANPLDGEIFFSDFSTQNLLQLCSDGTTRQLASDDEKCRFADGVLVPSPSTDAETKAIYTVREDHSKEDQKEPQNTIVSIEESPDGVWGKTSTLQAEGNDFYASPRVSPNGKQLAYVTWNHPSMPWDSTFLQIRELDNELHSSDSSTHEVVAGLDEDTSVLQPLWHPQTGDLYYISDQSGFYNIYRKGLSESILPMEHDFGGAAPGWILGEQGYDFLPDGRLISVYQKEGSSVMVIANVMNDGAATDIEEYGIEDGLPMQFGGIAGSTSNDLYFLGGGPAESTSVYKWNLDQRGAAEVLACSSSLSFSDDLISCPKQIEFPTTLGKAYGYYYAPRNDAFKCAETPPLLVKAHGGPTACTRTSFNPMIQYWTSRGFAILDVDYGGSTGYGREYRRRLRSSWGIVDVDDVCNGALYLAEKGEVDGDRLCIDGGSAGGYTTLAALAFRDVFKAGCSLYGIGDLTALAGDTHKFESRYLDGLVGRYPEDEQLYKDRSPIESVDTLSCPILLLQGEEDKVVPPNQARMMHEALLKKGIPTCLKIYDGEQHGFRQAKNIEDALDSELAFYGKVFGIEVPGAIDLDIDNL